MNDTIKRNNTHDRAQEQRFVNAYVTKDFIQNEILLQLNNRKINNPIKNIQKIRIDNSSNKMENNCMKRFST